MSSALTAHLEGISVYSFLERGKSRLRGEPLVPIRANIPE